MTNSNSFSGIGSFSNHSTSLSGLGVLFAFFSGLLLSLFISVGTTTPAFACPPPPAGKDDCSITEVVDGDKPGGGTNTPTPNPPKWETTPTNTIEVPCYYGISNWSKNSTCAFLPNYTGGEQSNVRAYIKNYAINNGRIPNITYHTINGPGMSACAPHPTRGQAYSATFLYNVKRLYILQVDANDNLMIGFPPVYQNNNILTLTFSGCNYPNKVATRQFQCFFDYAGAAYWSQNRNVIATGGSRSKTRAPLASDPKAPIWNGNVNTAPTCDRNSEGGRSAHVAIAIDPDDTNNGGATTYHGYAYYRLMPEFKQRQFSHMAWRIPNSTAIAAYRGDIMLREWESNYPSNNNIPPTYSTGWWVYSCHAGVEGRYGSSAALPNRNAYFSVGGCPTVITEWQCEITDPTTVAIDRTSLTPGSTYTGQVTTVMRNGEQIPITFSGIRIMDTGSGVDVTNGAAGTTIRNLSRIEYRTVVKDGSTPYYGTNPNDPAQLFRLWADVDTRENWGTWRSNDANADRNKLLSFNWSSMDEDSYFAAMRQWRVTAEFWVIRSSGEIIGGVGGGSAAPNTYEWVEDTQICYEKNTDGTNTSRFLNGESNPIKVIRAVNNPTEKD